MKDCRVRFRFSALAPRISRSRGKSIAKAAYRDLQEPRQQDLLSDDPGHQLDTIQGNPPKIYLRDTGLLYRLLNIKAAQAFILDQANGEEILGATVRQRNYEHSSDWLP